MKKLLDEEYNRIVEQQERWKLLGITLFSDSHKLWIKKVIKVRRRNSKFQGMTGVNWQRLVK